MEEKYYLVLLETEINYVDCDELAPRNSILGNNVNTTIQRPAT
jgi:hypothetical protein